MSSLTQFKQRLTEELYSMGGKLMNDSVKKEICEMINDSKEDGLAFKEQLEEDGHDAIVGQYQLSERMRNKRMQKRQARITEILESNTKAMINGFIHILLSKYFKDVNVAKIVSDNDNPKVINLIDDDVDIVGNDINSKQEADESESPQAFESDISAHSVSDDVNDQGQIETDEDVDGNDLENDDNKLNVSVFYERI